VTDIEVVTLELVAAAAVVRAGDSGLEAARSAVNGSAGALAGNAAAGAYAAFLGAVETAVTPSTEVDGELATALMQAAAAYSACDQSIAQASHPGP
jgi:hypothetical protein